MFIGILSKSYLYCDFLLILEKHLLIIRKQALDTKDLAWKYIYTIPKNRINVTVPSFQDNE